MVHFVSHVVVSAVIAKILNFDSEQLKCFVGANLIDIDHIFDGKMCDDTEEGGTFNNNLFHQIWPATITAGAIVDPYIGAGLALHFYLDYLDVKNPTSIPCGEIPVIPSIRYALREIGL